MMITKMIKPRFYLRILIWLVIVSGTIMALVIYNPNLLKPLIQAGIPLTNFSHIPIIGDTIRAANTPQITVQELKELIDTKNQDFVLVDVRSLVEYENAHIPGSVFIPLTDIEDGKGITKIKSLTSHKKLITYCSVGKRSNKALELLKKAGVTGTNVQGGINEWREKIDPAMPEL